MCGLSDFGPLLVRRIEDRGSMETNLQEIERSSSPMLFSSADGSESGDYSNATATFTSSSSCENSTESNDAKASNEEQNEDIDQNEGNFVRFRPVAIHYRRSDEKYRKFGG